MLEDGAVYTEAEALAALRKPSPAAVAGSAPSSPKAHADAHQAAGATGAGESAELAQGTPPAAEHSAVDDAAARLHALVEAGRCAVRHVRHANRTCALYYLVPVSPSSATSGPTAGTGTPPDSATAGRSTPCKAAATDGLPGSGMAGDASPAAKRAPTASTLTVSATDMLRRRELLAERSALEARHNKLQLVRTYRTSQDTVDLDTLTEKWRGAAAQALEVLADAHAEATVPKLLEIYGIPPAQVGYNLENECFD